MEEALVKRIMPHSLEAEQSVIGSMIMDRDAILTASEQLVKDDFYNSSNNINIFRKFSSTGIHSSKTA